MKRSIKKDYLNQNCKCPCCGYFTIAMEHGAPFYGDICPVCFWEMDLLTDPEKPSEANHGLTLKEAQKNYQTFGACRKEYWNSVRKPKSEELSGVDIL